MKASIMPLVAAILLTAGCGSVSQTGLSRLSESPSDKFMDQFRARLGTYTLKVAIVQEYRIPIQTERQLHQTFEQDENGTVGEAGGGASFSINDEYSVRVRFENTTEPRNNFTATPRAEGMKLSVDKATARYDDASEQAQAFRQNLTRMTYNGFRASLMQSGIELEPYENVKRVAVTYELDDKPDEYAIFRYGTTFFDADDKVLLVWANEGHKPYR